MASPIPDVAPVMTTFFAILFPSVKDYKSLLVIKQFYEYTF